MFVTVRHCPLVVGKEAFPGTVAVHQENRRRPEPGSLYSADYETVQTTWNVDLTSETTPWKWGLQTRMRIGDGRGDVQFTSSSNFFCSFPMWKYWALCSLRTSLLDLIIFHERSLFSKSSISDPYPYYELNISRKTVPYEC